MAIGLDHPFIVGVSNIIHLDPGPTVALMTVVFIFGGMFLWITVFSLLLQIADECRTKYQNTNGLEAFFWWLLMLPFLLAAFAMELIISLLAIWVGYSMLKGFRDWWHKGQ